MNEQATQLIFEKKILRAKSLYCIYLFVGQIWRICGPEVAPRLGV